MWLPYEPHLTVALKGALLYPPKPLSISSSFWILYVVLTGAICLLSSWLECKLHESRTESVLVIMVVLASGIQLSSVVVCLMGRWNKFKIMGSNAFILQTSVRLRRVKMTDVTFACARHPSHELSLPVRSSLILKSLWKQYMVMICLSI